MTNEEKFCTIWGHNAPWLLSEGWWKNQFHDVCSPCCENCKQYYGKKTDCPKMHGIQNPEKQGCIAFERR